MNIPLSKSEKKAKVESMIRVNHAGEYGAKRIYQGQLEVLAETDAYETVKEMHDQELKHLEYFEEEIITRGTRPTLLMPLWHFLGFGLGKITAKIGKEAAMACTVAVEEVIEEHYEEQLAELNELGDENELATAIKKFQAEEIEHKNTAIKNDALETVGYTLLSAFIKKASRCAIWLSKRI